MEAELTKFPPELGAIAAAFTPAPFQVFDKRAQNAPTRGMLPQRRLSELKPLSDCLSLRPELCGDARDCQACRTHSSSGFEPTLSTRTRRIAGSLSHGDRWLGWAGLYHGRSREEIRSDGIGSTACCGTEPIRERLDGNAKITKQVPPVGDLDRRGGTLTDPVSIGAGAIASDDLDPRVIAVRIPGSCRPRFREIVAQHSELMSPGVPI